MTEEIHNTVPSYRNKYLPERYTKNLLGSTNLTLEENKAVRKNLI